MSHFLNTYQSYLSEFESVLKRKCGGMNYQPAVLAESMRYSLLSGGKRVRPVLFFAALDMLGIDYKSEGNFAFALECIHTYSLIHDDLPAMDNDDFRRGNPSNHKVFGEANAILAGDGLLSLACEIVLSEGAKDAAHLKAAQVLIGAAGTEGMIAGQSADLFYTGKPATEKELFYIYEKKTAALIAAPLYMAATLAGSYQAEMQEFGTNLGVLFQLTDDILDAKGDERKVGKTLGKDEQEDKLTCVKIFGLKQSELLADQIAAKCSQILRGIGKSEFFKEFVRFVRERDN